MKKWKKKEEIQKISHSRTTVSVLSRFIRKITRRNTQTSSWRSEFGFNYSDSHSPMKNVRDPENIYIQQRLQGKSRTFFFGKFSWMCHALFHRVFFCLNSSSRLLKILSCRRQKKIFLWQFSLSLLSTFQKKTQLLLVWKNFQNFEYWFCRTKSAFLELNRRAQISFALEFQLC